MTATTADDWNTHRAHWLSACQSNIQQWVLSDAQIVSNCTATSPMTSYATSLGHQWSQINGPLSTKYPYQANKRLWLSDDVIGRHAAVESVLKTVDRVAGWGEPDRTDSGTGLKPATTAYVVTWSGHHSARQFNPLKPGVIIRWQSERSAPLKA